MDIADFSHNYKYKFIVPFFYITSWALMFLGPFLMPQLYQKICIYLLLHLAVKTTFLITIAIISFLKARRIYNRAEQMRSNKMIQGLNNNAYWNQVFHAFIIPSYKEDEELLSETIEKLAEHQGSKANYMVFLAMEAHQDKSDIKAQKLIQKHKHQFFIMGYTRHLLRQHEQRGKASNVSWCAQQLEEHFFIPNRIPIQKILVTIIDADSWVPEVYIRQVQDHLSKPEHSSKRERYIYQPNQIFTRNHLDVPIVTRVYDQLHGGMHSNNLLSLFNISFPLSNYSLQFTLAKKIGWWDTCADAIGEDFHMTEKCFWKTNGEVETVPIYAPFNQVNIQTGKGYMEDIKARFWQAQRHARGVSDVSYNINMLIHKPLRWRTFLVAFQVLQCFIMPALVPWALIAISFQSKVLFVYEKAPLQMISDTVISQIFTFNTILAYLAYFFYWLIKRRATTVLYGLENQSFLRILEYPILFFVVSMIITLPCYVIAAFGALFQGREYIVAQKVLQKKEINE